MAKKTILNGEYLIVAGVALVATLTKIAAYALSGGSALVDNVTVPILLVLGTYLFVYKKIKPAILTTVSFLIIGAIINFVLSGVLTPNDIFVKSIISIPILNTPYNGTIHIGMFTLILPIVFGYLAGIVGTSFKK